MLTELHILNFAIIQSSSVHLCGGMTAVTGETGAGKSILLDALNLVLGARSDSGLIRHEHSQAEITALFELEPATAAWNWLQQHDLMDETDPQCIIRRVINRNGKNRCTINGRIQPLQMLIELGELLVDIHGQHAHQGLLRRDQQRFLLDNYAQHPALCHAVAQTAKALQQTQRSIQALEKAETEQVQRMEFLRFQLQELAELAPQLDEWEELDQEQHRLASAEDLIQLCDQAQQGLQQDDGVLSLLSRVQLVLQSAERMDPQLAEINQLISEANINLAEAESSLNHYLSRLEMDPERLQQIDARLQSLSSAARKYRVDVNELPAYQQGLEQQLLDLENNDEALAELRLRAIQQGQELQQAADALTASRQQAAATLQQRISQEIEGLGMVGGKLEIQLLPRERIDSSGQETIEFWVSTNAGQPLKPLTKVASGGELARISLAIQVITAQESALPTLIFDEVDVGVGGAIAEVIGRKLSELGEQRQVICITHLPQVASQGQQHLQVIKQQQDNKTISEVIPLDYSQRIHEIARMLGGIELTQRTIQHAKEMLK